MFNKIVCKPDKIAHELTKYSTINTSNRAQETISHNKNKLGKNNWLIMFSLFQIIIF